MLRPIHTPTATLATIAAAASQDSRARWRRGGITLAPDTSGAAASNSLIRDSMFGHRSRPGSIERGSSANRVILRSVPSLEPLISAHLHTQSLAQQLARAM